MTRRAEAHPHRPQIRISSTFFYHLSSDYDLVPIPSLTTAAAQYDRGQLDVGEEQIIYEPIKVGQQVQKCVNANYEVLSLMMTPPVLTAN